MIEQGVLLFDRLVVALGTNMEKRYTFSSEERLAMLRASLASFQHFRGLVHRPVPDRFREVAGATHVLRGIRSATDYEYERTMRYINGDLGAEVCTVFLMPPRILPKSVQAWSKAWLPQRMGGSRPEVRPHARLRKAAPV